MALTRAHPRSRGEHKFNGTLDAEPRGSSPLARGTWEPGKYVFARARLIPARAGNMGSGLGSHLGTPAHPRSRGEHVRDFGHYRPVGGSSPLARGTLSAGRAC